MTSNLEKEIKHYSEINKQSELTITKLYQFFRTFARDGLKLIDKTKKILEEFLTELRKEPSSTTNNISFLSLYNDLHRYIENFGNVLSSIDKNVGDRLGDMIKKMQNNNNEGLSKLTSLSNMIIENKLKLEKYKHNYFNSCKSVMEQEKIIIKLEDNKKVKEEDFIINNDLLSKYVSNSENQEGMYKTEINKINKILESSEGEYLKIIQIFKDEYQNKLNCVLEIYGNFKQDINRNIEINAELIPKIEKAYKCLHIDRDMVAYSQSNNFLNENKRRFLLEKFLDYEIFKNSGIFDDNYDINNIYKNNKRRSKTMKKDMKTLLKVLRLDKDEEEEIDLKNPEDKFINEYLMNLIKDDNKLDNDKYNYICSFIKKSPDNIKLVINILLNQCKKSTFIKMQNIENLDLLSEILNSIINESFKNIDIFEQCYMVLFIAEKTIYLNKDNKYNKCYLCKILSKYEIFSEPKFWSEMIIRKIDIFGEVETKKEIEKREKEKNDNIKANKTIFNKVIGMFNYYYDKDKGKENEMIENEILFKQLYEEKLPLYSVEIIEDYIQHFSNFNFDQKNASKLILEMSEKYKFNESFVTYFMAKLNSNMSLNKEDLLRNKKENNIYEKELKELNYDNLYFNSSNNGSNIKYKRILEPKLRGLIFSLKYIDIKDFPNILALNKNCNKTLVKIIYKNIFIKYHDMDIKTHINIWKILLNYSEIKKLHDYKKIKEELKIEEYNAKTTIEQLKNSKDIIDLDIVRTNFDTNKKENQQKISSILKCIRHVKNNLKYCQGMNFIAAFLLNITNDEEETFYLYLSIFDSTDYGKLFIKDLEKLKKFFYVFGRLLNVLLPELDFYFKENKIDVSYFVSPWFITLFTNTFQNINDKKNPKILLRIFDLFFFSGWKSILKIGISLLKNYENIIMNLTFESLLHFLITKILKSDFFQKENYDQLIQITYNFKIKNSLIGDIENEYEMKKKLAKFGSKFSTGITEQ